MDRFAALTGRQYRLFDYFGAADAGARARADGLRRGDGARDDRVPERAAARSWASCRCTCSGRSRRVDLLDADPRYRQGDRRARSHEGTRCARRAALSGRGHRVRRGRGRQRRPRVMPRIVGGRYGLSSKEFTPAMVKAVFDNLASPSPKNHFTIGINDDVSHTSLDYDPRVRHRERPDVVGCIFYGLGADGTVGANKNSIKIIGEETAGYAQGFFVYDSKKSGSRTISHLRFGPQPIRSTYLVQRARFIACHQFQFVERVDMLGEATDGAVFLLNSPFGPERRLGRAAAHDAGGAHPQAHPALRHRRRHGGGRRGHGRPHQHHHADLLLRDLRRAAARRGDRTDQGRHRGDLRRKGHGARRAEFRGRRSRRSRICTKSRCRPRRRSTRAPLAGRAARTRREFVQAGHGHDDRRARRRAAGQRAARGRHVSVGHGAMGEAEHLRLRAGLEAGALHPVRQLRDGVPARRDPRALLRRVRAGRRARRLRVGAARRARVSRTCGSRCRWRSRTAPGASSASRRVPCEASKAAGIRAINMEAKAPILERERRNLEFFDDAARQHAGGARRGARARARST